MAITTRYYLDTRVAKGEAPLKLAIRKRHEAAYVSTGVKLLPDQWNAKAQRVINHPRKNSLNTYLDGFKFNADTFFRDLSLSGRAADLTARDLKNEFDEKMNGKKVFRPLGDIIKDIISSYDNPNSRASFESMIATMKRYDKNVESYPASRITEEWVHGYRMFLVKSGKSLNTQSIYLTALKRVLSIAVKDGEIASNPALTVKIQKPAVRHRDLTTDQIRLFLYAPCESDEELVARDFFAFSFYSRAANAKDVFGFSPSNLFNGRLYYKRAKTGKEYSVKVEPELQVLLDKYMNDRKLFSPIEKHKSGKSFLTIINTNLRSRASRLKLPIITTYWARHTFASLAFSLGYGMDLVSAALGHSLGGARVTSTYVSIKDKQIDDLARAVYDAVQNVPSTQSGNAADAGISTPETVSSTKK